MTALRSAFPRCAILWLSAPALGALVLFPGCGKKEPSPAPGAAARPAASVPQLVYVPQAIGEPMQGRPWIAHLCVVDLDGDGLPDVVVCDAQANQLRWIRQSPRGVYTETTIGDVMAPA